MLKLQRPVLSIGFILPIALQLVACSPDFRSQTSYLRNGAVSKHDSLIAKSVLRITMRSTSGILYSCTGTLIAPDVILTAAHCIIDEDTPTQVPYKTISVYQTRHHIWAKVEAKNTIVHPLYLEDEKSKLLDSPKSTTFSKYDIGLIKLKSPFPSEYIPAKIMKDFGQAFEQTAWIAGYGNTSYPASAKLKVSQPLKIGAITLAHNYPQAYPSSLYVANRPYATEILYWSTRKSPALCQGDSGGPLYFEKDGSVILIAVNSRTWNKAGKEACEANEQFQFATALTGEIREFVRSAYTDLTGRSADELLPEIKNDPNIPENYFGDLTLPQKNAWLDLTIFPLAISMVNPDFTSLTLVESRSSKENLCTVADIEGRKALITHVYPLDRTARGNSHVYSFSMTVENGTFKPLQRIEAYAHLEKNSVELIAITPDGLLRTKIPMTNCQ